MKSETRKPSFTIFGFGVVCFLLPFVALSCNHSAVAFTSEFDRYQPLDEGRSWKYLMTIKDVSRMMPGMTSEREVQMVVTVLKKRQLNGKEVVPVKTEAQAMGRSQFFFSYFAEDENGLYQFAQQGPTDSEPQLYTSINYYLRKPLTVANTWDTQLLLLDKHTVSAKARVEATDDVVDVPAGTFKSCLKVRTIGNGAPTANGLFRNTHSGDHSDWYAPSVGLVKSIYKENDEMTVSTQLESFTK